MYRHEKRKEKKSYPSKSWNKLNLFGWWCFNSLFCIDWAAGTSEQPYNGLVLENSTTNTNSDSTTNKKSIFMRKQNSS